MKLSVLDRYRIPGKILIEYDVRGCMAENHVLKAVWEVVEFGCQTKYIPGSQKIYMARCRLIQSRDDVEPVWCNIPVESIYPLPLGAHGQALGYAWRH